MSTQPLTPPSHGSQTLVDSLMQVMEAAFDPAFGEAWNRRQVSDALILPSTHALLVDESGALISEPFDITPAGFILSRHAADEEELLLIAVSPNHRGRGLGQKLIHRFFAHSAQRGVVRIFLEMRRGNPAIHLYQKVGFKAIGERPNYYKMQDGRRIDAITFARTL